MGLWGNKSRILKKNTFMFVLRISLIWNLSKQKGRGGLCSYFRTFPAFLFFHRLWWINSTHLWVYKHKKYLYLFKSLLSMLPVSQHMTLGHIEGRFHFGSNIWKYKVDKDKGANIRSKHVPSFLINILLDWWVSLINLLVSEKWNRFTITAKENCKLNSF